MKMWKSRYFLIVFLVLISGCRAITDDTTLNGAETVTVNGGESINVVVHVETREEFLTGDSGDWKSTSYTLDGRTVCVDHGDHFGRGEYTDSFNINAPADSGIYALSLIAYEDNNCSNNRTASDRASRANAITVVDSGGNTTACSAIFPGGVQSNSNTGIVKIKNRALINGSGSTIATNNLDENDGTCDGGACTEGSAAAPSTMVIKTGSGSDGDIEPRGDATVGNSGDNDFGKVVLESGNTLTFSSDQTEYFFNDSWDIKNDAVVLMAPGDYWVDGDITVASRGELRVNGSGTVRILASGTVTLNERAEVNVGGNTEQLLLYSNTKIELKPRALVNGFLYSTGDIIITERAVLTGGASAGGTLEVKERGIVNYVSPDGADFGDFCGGTSGPNVDHYAIFPTSPAVTCKAGSVRIEPHDSSHSAIPNDGATITLSTDVPNDGWVKITGNGTLVGNQYTFSGGESSVVLGLHKTSAATLNIDITDGAVTDLDGNADEDKDIVFDDLVLEFFRDDNADGNSDGGGSDLQTQSSGVAYNQAILKAVKTDETTGECVSALSAASLPVEMAYECNNPTRCIKNRDLRIGTVAIEENDNGSVTDYEAVTLTFDAQGEAAFPVNYFDAGAITLHARMDIPANGNDPAVNGVRGASNSFVVKPDHFDVSIPGNPESTSAGAGFKAAGENFTVVITAKNAAGNTTENFGNEISAEGVTLNFDSLTFPVGGQNGTLNAGSFLPTASAAEFESTTVNWIEVGTFKATANIGDGDYLGGGDVSTVTDDIGRFYPSHFKLESSAVSNSCVPAVGTAFSYIGENAVSANFSVSAKSTTASAEQTLRNYDRVDLAYPVTELDLVAENNNDGNNLGDGGDNRFVLTDASANWDDGVYDFAVSNGLMARLVVVGKVTAEPEFSSMLLGLKADDVLDIRSFDGQTMNASTTGNCMASNSCDAVPLAGGLRMRFGRAFTKDVHGPESSPLPVIFQSEYWDGSNWQLNTDDSCTRFSRSDIAFNGTRISSALTVDFDGTSGADTTGTLTDLTATEAGLSSGSAGLVFSAPGVGKTGSFPVDVDISAMPWLQFDWNQNGSHDNTLPTATVTFGSYRGHDRVIYWRERLAD